MKNSEAGQSLFEVVLALGVIATIIVGLVILSGGAIRNATFSKNNTLASRYLEEMSEWLRSQRDAGFSDFQANVLSTPRCFANLDWTKVGSCQDSDNIPGTILYRDGSFSTNLVSGKTLIEADMRVYWNDSSGFHESKSIIYLSDWRQR